MSFGSVDALIAGKKHAGRIKAYVRDANGRRFVGSVRVNGVRVADASTWFEVAEIVSRVTGRSFTGKSIQHYGSEGPRGFYVTLRDQ